MRPVQIAELKNHLSAYLHKVRAGEDRKSPIAKIVPFRDGGRLSSPERLGFEPRHCR